MSGKVDFDNKEIGAFFKAAQETEQATLADSELFGIIEDCHKYLLTCLSVTARHKERWTTLLALKSVHYFHSALRIAVSGQAGSTFGALRSALEAACYANVFSRDKDLLQVWLERGETEESRTKARNKLKGLVQRAADHAERRIEPAGRIIKDFHEAVIDFGAHPNMIGWKHHIRVGDITDGMLPVSVAGVYGADSLETYRALLACVEGLLPITIVLLTISHDEPTEAIELINSTTNAADRLREILISRGLDDTSNIYKMKYRSEITPP